MRTDEPTPRMCDTLLEARKTDTLGAIDSGEAASRARFNRLAVMASNMDCGGRESVVRIAIAGPAVRGFLCANSGLK